MNDVDTASADGASSADLLAALIDVEARKANDAECSNRNHQHDHHAEQRNHAAIVSVTSFCVVFVRSHPIDRAAQVRLGQLLLNFEDQRISSSGLGPHYVAYRWAIRNAGV